MPQTNFCICPPSQVNKFRPCNSVPSFANQSSTCCPASMATTLTDLYPYPSRATEAKNILQNSVMPKEIHYVCLYIPFQDTQIPSTTLTKRPTRTLDSLLEYCHSLSLKSHGNWAFTSPSSTNSQKAERIVWFLRSCPLPLPSCSHPPKSRRRIAQILSSAISAALGDFSFPEVVRAAYTLESTALKNVLSVAVNLRDQLARLSIEQYKEAASVSSRTFARNG